MSTRGWMGNSGNPFSAMWQHWGTPWASWGPVGVVSKAWAEPGPRRRSVLTGVVLQM